MGKQLINIENLNTIPSLVNEFELRASKVANKFEQLESQAKEKGLSKELDSVFQAFINGVKAAEKDFKGKRTPLTKRFDEIKKMFTAEENKLKDFANKAQKYRDAFAKKVHEENAKKQREAQAKKIKADEAVNLNARIEAEVRFKVQEKIDSFKNKILNAMQTVTEKNLEDKRDKLQNLNVNIDPKFFSTFKTGYTSKQGNDVAAILKDVLSRVEIELTEYYNKEMATYKQECLTVFRDMAKADKEKKEALIKEQKENIAIESQASKEIAEIQIENNKDAQLAQAAFESTVEVLDEAPESRKGFKIEVLDRSGYAALVAYWFSVLGASFDGSMERKTVGSMIKDLEKHAHKTGSKLMNDAIKYETVFKAVNRAS